MAETVRSELPNLWRSINEPRACRHLYQICPQTKCRFKRQPCYARSSTDTDLLIREKPMGQATDALVFENLLYEKKGDVAYVTVNRPKVLNALNRATFTEMGAAFADAGADPAVKGVILTGAGDKAFIAGADITELARATAGEQLDTARHGQDMLNVIENLGKPVVAAVNGFALGGGWEAAMGCTNRPGVGEAPVGQPEVELGLLPRGRGTQPVP